MSLSHSIAPVRPCSRRPSRPAPVRAVCPECRRAATLEQMVRGIVVGGFVECPHCAIGSPPAEWRRP